MFKIKAGWIFAFIALLQFFSSAKGGCYSSLSPFYIRKFTCTEYTEEIASLLVSRLFTLEMIHVSNVNPALDDLKSFLHKNQLYDVYKVIVKDSNLTKIPNILFTLKGLNVIELHGNNIKTVSLKMLSTAKNLTSFDVSNNQIKELEEDDAASVSSMNLESINLSYNKLNRIPSNCFTSSRNSLKYLHLSNNDITSVDSNAFANLISLKLIRLSHNKLTDLGYFLYPVQNLEILDLDHNRIQSITAIFFSQSKYLKNIDLSFNNIKTIDDNAFRSLESLKILNLSNNNIKSLTVILLSNNINLESLYLSYNNLTTIQPGIFTVLKTLHHISLEAALAMDIKTNTLSGLKVTELNLAGSNIYKIEGRPFMTMASDLKSLNMGSCSIQKISETALDNLTEIIQIDLSNNNLTKVDFLNVELKKLSRLLLQHNTISEIKKDTFQRLLSLTELNLSNNNIQKISPMTFKNLKNVKKIHLLNNKLDNTLLANTFLGLDHVLHLELMNTKYNRWDSDALSGLINLRVLNASHGELVTIDNNALKGLRNIQVLDLSYNQLQKIYLKQLPTEKVREIYMNNNNLKSITGNIFDGFSGLQILNIADTKLLTLDSSAFKSLRALKYLDLSYNPNVKVAKNVFDNLILNTLLLNHFNSKITFQYENVTITNLDMSSSHLTNINALYLQKIKSLITLNLSNNSLSNQLSFENNMVSLKSLNLSHNKIKNLNQATFVNTAYLSNLDLSFNEIDKIRFGTFRGLQNLKKLNLSNNRQSNFKLSLLYEMQSVSTIILDGNNIERLGLTDNLYKLKTFSIGEIVLPCDELVHLKSHSVVILTAKALDYKSENVDGISCYS